MIEYKKDLLKNQAVKNMEVFLSIGCIIFLAVLTQHLISWAGSVLSSISNPELSYSVFTFTDDRHLPMTTNILMNVFIPNVFMVIIFALAKLHDFYYVQKYLILYVIAFFVYRMILICVILRRKEMYNFLYELCMFLFGVLLAYLLIKYFLNTESDIFLDVSTLKEELWIAVLFVSYKFFKWVLDNKVKQDTVLTKRQISKYITHKFDRFYKKYNDNVLSIDYENNYVCILLYSIMIFEDYNRGPIARTLERLKVKIVKTATVGIMQIKSDKPLSDKESVIEAYKLIYKMVKDSGTFDIDEELARKIAYEYNTDESYPESIIYIYLTLIKYLNEIPKYKKDFMLNEEKKKERKKVKVRKVVKSKTHCE